MSASLERENLYSAVMAVQLGIVSLDDVIALLQDVENRDKPLGELLQTQQKLAPDQLRMLTSVLELHRSAHGGDVERCLMSLVVNDSAKSIVDELTPHGHDVTVEFSPASDPSTHHYDPLTRVTASGQRYRKLLAHAKGGLGEVSVARDDQLKREVALKELQEQHADDPIKQQRFLLEGEVTGALEHPGIVPVYSLGFDAQARPFYAMRFIRGQTLQEAINQYHQSVPEASLFDRNSLKFRRLLMRLVDVCNAIEYAHSRGVLHRDIKPSNVMLGKYGETYVVDWGMARVQHAYERIPESRSESPLLTAELSGSSDTQMGSAMGTPAFMSPEQAAGALDRIGVRSDVYSLGASLYTLLCNRPPFEKDDLLTILRKVQEGEFEQPRLRMPRLPKKLEAICLKAMALEPADRYSSAAGLAQDLENWLGDEPILASPDTWTERTFRFVRRHRTWALAGGTAAILMALTATVAALMINRARSQAELLAEQNSQLAVAEATSRQQAEQRFFEARETVDTWLTGFTEALRNYPGASGFRQHMLERAVKEYESFADQIGDDEAVQLERGRTLLRLGDLQRQLARSEQATKSYRQAISVLTDYAEQARSEDNLRSVNLVIAKAHGRLALSENDQADTTLARKSFEEALQLAGQLSNSSQTDHEVATLESSLRVNFGQFQLQQDQIDQAQRQFTAAIQQLEAAIKREPDVLLLRVNLAAARIGWGQSQLLRGDATSARLQFSNALSVYRAISELHPEEPKYLERVAMASLYLASAERRLGELANEAQSYQQAIEVYEQLIRELPGAIVYQENLALTYTDLGQLQLGLNKPAQAIETLREAKRLLTLLAQTNPSIPRFHEGRAIAADNLAQALTVRAAYQEALGESKQAVQIFEQLGRAYPDIPAYAERLAVAESHLAQIWYRLEEYDSSERTVAAAGRRLTGLVNDHTESVSHRYFLALVQAIQGDLLWQRNDTEAASTAYRDAASHWKLLMEVTNDPAYLNDAAWFFASCADHTVRDTSIALSAAELATKAAPSNERFRDTKALVLFRKGRFDACLQLLAPDDDLSSLEHGRSMLIAAMAMHKAGDQTAAQDQLRAAQEWIRENQPGDWELTVLELECRRILEGTDAG